METITLKYPVNINNNQVHVLKLRRPLVRDMLAAEKMAGLRGGERNTNARQSVRGGTGYHPGAGYGGLCADAGKVPGFFVIRPTDVRVICATLAHYTGWPLRELLALTGEELLAWLDALKRGPLRSRHPEST